MVHFSIERYSFSSLILLSRYYIRLELCGYCMVIVRLLCGADEESGGADNLPNVQEKREIW